MDGGAVRKADSVCFAGASQLAFWVRAKQLSPTEIVRAHFERIAAVDDKLHAMATVEAEGALAAARAAAALAL